VLRGLGHHVSARRTLSQQPPNGKIPVAPADDNVRVRRRDRLGGAINEYSQVACGADIVGTDGYQRSEPVAL
jgi:hypothetical protein